MLTPIGKYLRKLRIDTDESMGDMARRIGISKTYLSFIENGTRELKQDLAAKIMDVYGLGGNEKAGDFLTAYYRTPVKVVTIDTDDIRHIPGAISLAQLFALALPKLNEEIVQDLSSILLKTITDNGIEGVIGDLS